MPVFAGQYLEYYNPQQHTPSSVRNHLREVFARLPLSILCIGWNLPDAIVEICAKEATRHAASLYRWHPLLTGGNGVSLRPEWRTLGISGEPVPGFHGLPEFTFLCPNSPAVQDAIMANLHTCLSRGFYQGVFLDRIRFPSPSADPIRDMACFCPACTKLAAEIDLDLMAIRSYLRKLVKKTAGRKDILRAIFSDIFYPSIQNSIQDESIGKWLDFRQNSITPQVSQAARLAHSLGCRVGLDTFSPTLTRMVGQDLKALATTCEWIKPMSYAHALGPSGLPFELLGLARWLVAGGSTEAESLSVLSEITRIPLPGQFDQLASEGIPSATLEAETRLARGLNIQTILAGMALVEKEGINTVAENAIAAEVAAYRMGGAAGLLLAWDLWYIPLERLERISREWN